MGFSVVKREVNVYMRCRGCLRQWRQWYSVLGQAPNTLYIWRYVKLRH